MKSETTVAITKRVVIFTFKSVSAPYRIVESVVYFLPELRTVESLGINTIERIWKRSISKGGGDCLVVEVNIAIIKESGISRERTNYRSRLNCIQKI